MKTKAAYKRTHQIVTAIIRDWDPYSLLAGGAPADEFDAEIASVVTQVPRIKSEKDAALALSRVFSSAFEPTEFTPERCAAPGTKLFAALAASDLIDS
ncbi:MAG: DUF1871 family protein [Gemmataceae bacterium]